MRESHVVTERAAAQPGPRDLVDEVEQVLADCGFVRSVVEISTDGPGSTYVVVITPHIEAVPGEGFDDADLEGGRPHLDASAGVRVYAIPDADITPRQRRILERADGVDLTYDIDDSPPEDPDSPKAAALQVNQWVSEGPWRRRMAYSFSNEPLSYYSANRSDRPTSLVTMTLHADVWDEVASAY